MQNSILLLICCVPASHPFFNWDDELSGICCSSAKLFQTHRTLTLIGASPLLLIARVARAWRGAEGSYEIHQRRRWTTSLWKL